MCRQSLIVHILMYLFMCIFCALCVFYMNITKLINKPLVLKCIFINWTISAQIRTVSTEPYSAAQLISVAKQQIPRLDSEFAECEKLWFLVI